MPTYNDPIEYNAAVAYNVSNAGVTIVAPKLTATAQARIPGIDPGGSPTVSIDNAASASASAKNPTLVTVAVISAPTAKATARMWSAYGEVIFQNVLYSEVDKSTWIWAPNFVRRRHRFRGVRESLKINQEMSQLRYDLNRLESRNIDVNTLLANGLDELLDGTEVDATYSYATDVAVGLNPVELIGLNDMSIRISNLHERVRILEDR